MSNCTLCGLPTPDEPVTDPAVEGRFCCRGCLEVTRTLGTVDPDTDSDDADVEQSALEAAIATGSGREGDGNRDRDRDGGQSTAEPASADDADDLETTYLSVSGMHCSTCETFLSARATATPGVRSATASYPSDTMRIQYDPDRLDEDDLVETVAGVGYDATVRDADHDPDDDDATIARLLIGGFFGMMAMTWYVLFLYPTYFGYDPVVTFGRFDGLYLAAQIWGFTSVILLYTGFPILRGAYVSLRAGQPNMDLLVALAATGAYLYSTLAIAVGRMDLYFDVTIAVVMVVTAGTYYEDRIKRRAAGLLSELTGEQVTEARRESGDVVSVAEVEPGDRLLVRPGERIPLDGVVVDGVAAVDEALVTGESLPVTKRHGDEVIGGAIVTDAPLIVEVDERATSTLDRLVDRLWEIQSTQSGVQQIADRLATVFVPLVVVLSVATTALLLAIGTPPTRAALIGLTVLIVSCPCALGLATPLAVATGLRAAAREGIVIQSRTVFEELPTVETVVLDKTGTLTRGELAVIDVDADGGAPDDLLATAAAVERFSDHPVANAIVERDATVTPRTPAPDGGNAEEHPAAVEEHPTAVEARPTAAHAEDTRISTPREDVDVSTIEVLSKGITATVDGQAVIVGHPSVFETRDWTVPGTVADAVERARQDGHVPAVVGWDGTARGVIAVGDVPRNDWQTVLDELHRDGREVVILTGDDGTAADQFDDHPAVSATIRGVPPDGKTAAVARLRADRDGGVAMIGDGTNDAPALAAADVGVSLASGADLAADAADAVLVTGDLNVVPTFFAVADGTRRRIRQNLGWAFVYNGLAIPTAIAGVLNPLFAALAMGISSLLVVLNSSRSLVRSDE